jgi:poly-beta-1,6-N-acetyl-D-glucosamine synthase
MEDTYVLITPVRNEETFIRFTINTILQQTLLPTRWVIVDDASIDATPEILKEYSQRVDFISIITIDRNPHRSYGSRVNAVLLGYEKLADTHSTFVGILDSDISLPSDYYESIIREFSLDPQLGVAGGVVFDTDNGKMDDIRSKTLEHVAGGVQMFRRDCYDAIGGYVPLQWGGDDYVAEVSARKLGWRSQSFPNIHVLHRRVTGSEEVKNTLFLKAREGFMDYSIGYSHFYHALKCINRIKEKPIIISFFARQLGYYWAAIKLRKPSVPPDFVEYARKEQMAKIKERINIAVGLPNKFLKI